ncbi:MAG: sulfotransferase family 2 domain-containing protein [Gammaproteobacteria bacterium]
MIISHRHRFIFIAVPKVATRALRQALTMHLDSMDWQQQNLFAARRLPIAELARKTHGHLSAREIRPHLPEELWQAYTRFAFVRDPHERFVDICLFLDGAQDLPPAEARGRMKQAIRTERFRQRPLALPQSEFLVDREGRLAVDFIGRYENLQSSYDELCALIGIETSRLERRRVPESRDWRSYYDRELADLVSDFYRADLENFGYAPDGFAAPAG